MILRRWTFLEIFINSILSLFWQIICMELLWMLVMIFFWLPLQHINSKLKLLETVHFSIYEKILCRNNICSSYEKILGILNSYRDISPPNICLKCPIFFMLFEVLHIFIPLALLKVWIFLFRMGFKTNFFIKK